MSDLVERARSKSPYLKDSSAERLIDELADEIDRLRAVLRYISQLDDDGEAPVLARRALEPKP